MNSEAFSEDVRFIGPPLEEGPLPTLFYFALSAKESLEKDPYNQLVQFLEGAPLRIFSVTLPAHDTDLSPDEAINCWETRMKEGDLVIPPFVEKLKQVLHNLKPYIKEGHLLAAGLSRGAFVATHFAAQCPEITHVLGFAPLTRFRTEQSLDLERLIPSLYKKKVRFYIGNHDMRVGTDHAFSFIQNLAKEAHTHRIRTSPIELIIGPSIGYQGHGTAPQTFQSGAEWVKGALL